MTAKATFTLEADPQKVIAAITKLEEKVASLEAKNRELRESSRRGTDEGVKGLSAMDRTIGKVVSGVASMGAAFLSLSGALSVLRALDDRLDSIAKKSNEMGRASKDLASQVSPEVVKAVSKQAADMGVKPTEAVQYAGTLTAVFGEAGMQKAMPSANKLRKMDVASEDISALATAASAGNMEFQDAAAAFGQASKDSALPPKEFIKAAPAWMEYKDTRTGMAASTALAAGGVAPGSLMDRTKDLSLGLKLDSDLKKKAEKAAGGANEYASLSELDQLAVMKSVIPDLNQDSKLSIEEVMKAGVTEQQKAQSIAIAANQIDVFRREESAVMQANPEVLDSIIGQQEQNPTVDSANRAEASAALAEYTSSYGPTADTARASQARKQEVGKKLMQDDIPVGWNSDTGEANWFGRFVNFFAESGQYQMGANGMGSVSPSISEVSDALGRSTPAESGTARASAMSSTASESVQSAAGPVANVMTEDTGKKIESHLAVIADNTRQARGEEKTSSPNVARNSHV